MNKLFEHYAIEKNITEIEHIFENVFSEYEENLGKVSKKIEEDSYVYFKKELSLTTPDNINNNIICYFVFFDIGNIEKFNYKKESFLEEIKVNIDGKFFLKKEKPFIQINIPVVLVRIVNKGFYLFAEKERYLSAFEHEATHAYNYLLEKENKKISNFIDDYQKNIVDKNCEDDKDFYLLLYWLWDKDEFSAWMFFDPKLDKSFLEKKDEIIDRLKANKNPSFWKRQRDFMYLMADSQSLKNRIPTSAADFKYWFIRETEEKYKVFKKKQLKNRYQKEEADRDKEDIEKQLKEQIKEIKNENHISFDPLKFYFCIKVFSLKKDNFININIVINTKENILLSDLHDEEIIELLDPIAYLYMNEKKYIFNNKNSIKQVLNVIGDKKEDIDLFANDIYNKVNFE
jgi:hypothetical protein